MGQNVNRVSRRLLSVFIIFRHWPAVVGRVPCNLKRCAAQQKLSQYWGSLFGVRIYLLHRSGVFSSRVLIS